MSAPVGKMPADAVFEGGGPKGIGLCGAVEVFEREYEWRKVAGASAGAINAALIALGYSGAEGSEIVMGTPLRRMRDLELGIPVVGHLYGLLRGKGLYKGDYFLGWLRELVQEKTGNADYTFAELEAAFCRRVEAAHPEGPYRYQEGRDAGSPLRLCVTDVAQTRLLILPDDAPKFGRRPDNLTIAEAVRASMSIPLFFYPVRSRPLDEETLIPLRETHDFVDGGVLANFPVWVFDSGPGIRPRWPTFGFVLDEGRDAYRPTRGLLRYVAALARIRLWQQQQVPIWYAKPWDAERIVRIPTIGVETTSFGISDRKKQDLLDSGRDAAELLLKTFTFANHLRNRGFPTYAAPPMGSP